MPILTVIVFTLALALSLAAQAPETKAPEESRPVDARSTPRGAIFGFLEACHIGEYRRAASFLDIRGGRRTADPEELARQFKDILDRRLTTDPAKLSGSAEGDLTDGLDPKFELLGTVTLGGRRVELLLERSDTSQLWLVASGTVNMIPVLHEDIGNTWFETQLPEWLRAKGPLDSAVWQWLALLLLAALAWALAALFSGVLVRALRPVVRRTPTDFDDDLIASIVNPIRLLVALAIYRAGIAWIAPPVLMRSYLARILALVGYVALAWLAMRFIDLIGTKVLASMTGRQRASASSVVPLMRRTAKVGAVILALLATLSNWGYDTTALLAGLGVGGLAIALAAQKTIENLFGGVALTTDKPVLIGDFCRYGDKFGVVEDIGLRSTRVRTLERTVVTVPNGQFSGLEIENYARRDKIWFHPTLRLRLDTSVDQVRTLIGSLRDILLKNPKVDPSPARVRFIGISQYSLDIEIFAYVMTADFDEFLVVQEGLLLEIMDAIAQAGAALALPAQRNVLEREPSRHPDPDKPRVVTGDLDGNS